MASDPEEFEALYAAHHREILAYCARRLPRNDALDAAADIFTVAWRRFDEIPPGDRALSWLYAVAYRVLGNQWRRRRRWGRLVGRLRGMAQPAVWEDLKPSQIAEVLGISRAAVDQRFHRAKQRLTQQMSSASQTQNATPDRKRGVA